MVTENFIIRVYKNGSKKLIRIIILFINKTALKLFNAEKYEWKL